jgi:hypothetical protein
MGTHAANGGQSGKKSANGVRIHGDDHADEEIADVTDQATFEAIGKAGIEGVFHVLVDSDGFVGRIEKVKADLDQLHDDENERQKQNIVKRVHWIPPVENARS